eukprot:jgi/Hompol1/6441/HPOL_001706-RA
MRVTAFCTAEKYDSAKMFAILKQHYHILPFMADDIVHVRLIEDATVPTSFTAGSESRRDAPATQTSDGVTVTISDPSSAEAFFFTNGTFVTWGATDAQNNRLLSLMRDCEQNRYRSVESEWFDYFNDMSQSGGMVSDTIVIGNDLPADQAMLAYSAGLTRSVKLA